jgi:Uma2 family endonuclease
MSTITQRTIQPPPLYRMTVNEYERLAAAGILADDRVELIDGYLVKKMPKNPPHSFSTQEISDRLRGLLPAGWTRRQEQPVRIPDFDEPEPDVTIVRGRNADYRLRIPEPSDVAAVIEVSETTLDFDQSEKLLAYAKGRIPVYWIVNLVDRQVEVYTGPSVGGYLSRQDFKPGEAVPVVIDGAEVSRIAVADILP